MKDGAKNALLVAGLLLACAASGVYLFRTDFWGRTLRELSDGALREAGLGAVQQIEIDVTAELPVALSAEFPLWIHIRNLHDAPRYLRGIEVPLAGSGPIALDGSDPPPVRTESVRGGAWRAFVFDEEIPAEGKLTVQLDARAVALGTASDVLHVCIDSAFTCLPIQLSVPVVP